MFEVEKSFSFEAGHVLTHHDGKCQNVHGHSYYVKIILQKEELQSEGSEKNMVCDFARISKAAKPMLATYFDHCFLNETLQTDSPTAEFIAKWIFDHLKADLPALYAVKVQETGTAVATYKSF